MFTHFEGTGGCEWFGGELDAFVRHYNEKLGTNYVLTKCLDIVKISGITPKEPEVLLTDNNTNQQIVIERKSVVWPGTYVYRHQLEHKFASLIWRGANGLFRDASYRLVVNLREFSRLNSKHIKEAGQKIGDYISRLTPADLPIQKTEPINWSFRKSYPGDEEEDPNGIVVSYHARMTLDDFDHEEAKAGLRSQIELQLNAAAEKFNRYSNHVRLVLLDFYSNELWEDDVPLIMETISIPGVIDEIWRTIRDWVSADDYEIGYERLFKR